MIDPAAWSHQVFSAINAGSTARVHELLAYKPEGLDLDLPRSYGHSFMTQACGLGEERIVQLLLAAGANPSAQDDEGDFPLESAAHGEFVGVFQCLLAAGADPEFDPDGRLEMIDENHACWGVFQEALARKRSATRRVALMDVATTPAPAPSRPPKM